MNFEPTLIFLKKLSKNNNREWFEKNKPHFLELKSHFEDFAAELLKEAVKFDESLGGLDPKKAVFRIYRDIRFSKDKTPYKTNMSLGYSSAGKGTGIPGYYVQIEPDNKSFIAAGLYMPSADHLAKVRQEVDYSGDRLVKILNEKKFKKDFGNLWDEDKLKTMPKGYPKDHPHIELLKLKSFMVLHYFTDAEVTNKKFVKNLAGIMKTAKPLNDFLIEALH